MSGRPAPRLLRVDGSPTVKRIGAPRDLIADLYHVLLSLSWGQIALILGSLYCGLSLFFAVLYAAGGNCINGARPGHLQDYFFFSVQTLATIGYGVMHPIGDYANLLVSLEAFCGLMAFSLMTGLIFSKFSMPNARVLFTQKAVLGRRDGMPALMFRVANARGNHIVEARFNLTLNRCEPVEGDPNYRRFHRLALVVPESPLFVLSFTATHIIDEQSPLYGLSLSQMQAADCNFTLTLIGLDALVSQTVHARRNYDATAIVENARFADTLFRQEDGSFVLDYHKFDEVVSYDL